MLTHKAFFESEAKVLEFLPKKFQVVVVPLKEGVMVYGEPKRCGQSRGDHLANCLLAGAKVSLNEQAKILRNS